MVNVDKNSNNNKPVNTVVLLGKWFTKLVGGSSAVKHEQLTKYPNGLVKKTIGTGYIQNGNDIIASVAKTDNGDWLLHTGRRIGLADPVESHLCHNLDQVAERLHDVLEFWIDDAPENQGFYLVIEYTSRRLASKNK